MAELLQRLRERKLVRWASTYIGIAILPAPLKVDPAWDPLRADPRLDASLKNTEMSP